MSQSTAKTLALLELVADGHRTLPELADASRMPKSTAHRLVSVLVEHGYLKHDGREYGLGLKLLELGELVRNDLHVARAARPHMERLAHETSESVHLGELDGSYIVYTEKVEGSRGLRMASRVGLRSPAQTTAMGKVLLSHLAPDDLGERLLDLQPRTENTVTDKSAMRDELAHVRNVGFALDREENEVGIRCIAAPVWNANGEVVAAVSLSGATQFITAERQRELVPSVLSCAAAISRELGGGRFADAREFGQSA